MYVTLETDYAIRIIDTLARHEGRRMGAKLIAEEGCVTLRFSLKILRKLATSGLVRSYKGAQGGYELARPLEKITPNDVLEAIEGPYLLNRCLRDGHVCSRMPDGQCPYHRLFGKITHTVRQELSSLSFADILDEKKQLTPKHAGSGAG